MSWRTMLAFGMCTILLWGCQSAAPAGRDLRQQAAQEATAIIQHAQATALMLQAQAQATAMVQQAESILSAAESAAAGTAQASLGTPAAALAPALLSPQPADAQQLETPAMPLATEDPAAVSQVSVVEVTFAADGGMIMVSYLAPPRVSAGFYQGTVSLLEENRGDTYTEVAVVPVVGPLIARPVDPGQPGYVMLINGPSPLNPGDVVTVKLGEYTFEHIQVGAQE